MQHSTKKAIIDSGVWIAAKHASDRYYCNAAEIVKALDNNRIFICLYH